MACGTCHKFDSYKSQGGLPHWFTFGWCPVKGKTVAETDDCENTPYHAIVDLAKGDDTEYAI